LVSGVSAAVEAILVQFSSSRTIVQKALSGDSTINPSLGRLVLQCLCPALHNLLTDGLKPHQSDLIAGRRPNSAWSLVQATTRTGPKTQALFNLQIRVGELPQLRQSIQRFNAFLLGLLNLSGVKKEETKTNGPDLQDQAGSNYSPVSGTQVPWSLGRLFGASKSPNSPTGHTPPTRRPSQWLAPGVTALTRMVSSSSTPTLRGTSEFQEAGDTDSEKKTDAMEMKEKPRQFR
ncbi:hypothetical protein XENOCAPTIV_008637, partial [Xenoophorus captivus]